VAVASDLGVSSRYHDRRSLNYGAKVHDLLGWSPRVAAERIATDVRTWAEAAASGPPRIGLRT